jgi:hypothetical protein
MTKELPSIELLRQLLDYDPETGLLTWKPRPLEMFAGQDLRICNTWNTRYAGREALGHVDAQGYKAGHVNSVYLKAHRIVWKLLNEVDPTGQIDHINGDRADNRAVNLRDVSQHGNQRNAGLRHDNKSGHAGVHIRTSGQITAYVCGRYIGVFPTVDAAVEARRKAEDALGFLGAARNRKGRP